MNLEAEKASLAESHFRAVRRGGRLLIGQTTLGTLRLTFLPPRCYRLERLGTIFNPRATLLSEGRKGIVKDVLTNLYCVG